MLLFLLSDQVTGEDKAPGLDVAPSSGSVVFVQGQTSADLIVTIMADDASFPAFGSFLVKLRNEIL